MTEREIPLERKLKILADAAKYDVACTSSGSSRRGKKGHLGNTVSAGICHTFSSDGRCVSLLKILFSNDCVFDCKYCPSRAANEKERATFTPEEICRLVVEFYRRNYIEGLFLSSAVLGTPDRTMELMIEALHILREEYHFNGYIHVKAIPGADPALIEKAGFLADRMSINLELPTANGLKQLAPCKSRHTILSPMRQIQNGITENQNELMVYRKAPKFVPAGQSTQMIIGATPENDYQIMRVSEALYEKFHLKRVFYSAFINVNGDSSLPVLPGGPPLLREHRLYQADWLLRYYHFHVDELLSEARPDFNIYLDPKCDWAVRHLEYFPIEIQKADYRTLLRVPGIGYKSAQRIIRARRHANLGFDDLKRMGVVLKRALYFITCSGRMMYPTKLDEDYICRSLIADRTQIPREIREAGYQQLSLFS